MNEDVKTLIEDTTVEMMDVFTKMSINNFDKHRHDMVTIMISIVSSLNATILHSFCDTIMSDKQSNSKSQAYHDEYAEIFGDFMMKIGGSAFSTCVTKIESLKK